MKTVRTPKPAPLARSLTGSDAIEVAAQLRVALVRIHRQLRSRTGGELTPSQTSALARIDQAGPLRLGILADVEGTSAATMSKVVDSLEQRGLTVRVADPDDGRASLIQLSPEGGALLGELRARSTEALRAALAALNDDERETVTHAIAVLERLSDLLNYGER